MIVLKDVAKTFVMHLRDGTVLPVVKGVTFDVCAGECVVLGGPSGTGKSSILKMIYGNYRTSDGEILVKHDGDWVDVSQALPRTMIALRETTLGYVSQFLRTIPRVSALDVVAGAAREAGANPGQANERASELLARLNIPEQLWSLPPATFSGGEQQRINIARGFAAERPILLLDEPTASLDAANRAVVVDLIENRKAAGTTILGIFHDADVRERVASRTVDVTAFAA
ncbi:MAG: phosphonate C-P lyase system protein PhnL [Pseudomonadota bacterium]